jgi:chromosome segregation ATPase
LEQQTLEAQLVVTEEVANLQHLALTQLKHQLSCQQQALDDQISQARTRDQTVQELLASIETLANEQRIEIESLRSQLSVDRRAIHNNHKQLEKQLIQRQTELQSKQQQVQELESQILVARTHAVCLEGQLAEQERHIQGLYSRLGDRAYFLNQLEAQLQQAHDTLEAQQDLHTSLLQTQALSRAQNTTITALHSKIEALETQLAQHLTMAAQLQQACRELTAERDHYQSRTSELEGHQSALQEQILMQAQQASEYEAAVQYWKDQCITSTRQSQQMKELLERVLPDRPEEVLELLMAIQPQEPSLQSESSQPIKHLQVDLPAFLRKTLPDA